MLQTPGQTNLSQEELEFAMQQEQANRMRQLLKLATDMECEKCQNTTFLKVSKIKVVSGLVAGTGRDIIIPVEIFACSDCGHINPQFLAKIDEASE